MLQERDAGAVDDAGEDVPAELVGPEEVHEARPVRPPGRLEPLADVLLDRIEPRQHRGEHRRRDDADHHDQAEERGPPADQPGHVRIRGSR